MLWTCRGSSPPEWVVQRRLFYQSQSAPAQLCHDLQQQPASQSRGSTSMCQECRRSMICGGASCHHQAGRCQTLQQVRDGLSLNAAGRLPTKAGCCFSKLATHSKLSKGCNSLVIFRWCQSSDHHAGVSRVQLPSPVIFARAPLYAVQFNVQTFSELGPPTRVSSVYANSYASLYAAENKPARPGVC